MKILKEGRMPDSDTFHITCDRCGCEFEANEDDFKTPSIRDRIMLHIIATCECPYCGTVLNIPIFSERMKEINGQ